MNGRGQVWYLGLCVLFGAGMVVQTIGQRWSGDYWAHRSAVLELSHHPWSRVQPYTGSHVADPELSPYTLALGLAARGSPFGVADLLSVAALVNVALFLIALRRFVGRFSKAAMAPFWTLLATLFLWGLEPWRWSGYLNANSIGFGLPYPSMFAAALLLFAVCALIDFCDEGRSSQLAALVVLAPVVVLTHPFTGAAMGVAALAVFVNRLPRMPPRRIGALAGGAAAVVAAVVGWPLYPALGLLGVSGQYDQPHALLYRLVVQRTVLALVAVPVLALRFRADHRDPLALMATIATIIFVLGGLTERYSLGRILPLGMLALHAAVGVWLAERAPVLWRRGTSARRLLSAFAGAAVAGTGVMGCRGGLARVVPEGLLPARVADDPRLDAGDGGLAFLGRETTPDDVCFVATLGAARIAPAFGAKVVAPGYIAPFLKDNDRRQADAVRFFTTPSPDERQGLIDRYGVSCVLFDLRVGTAYESLGRVAYRDDRYVLVAVGHGHSRRGSPP